MKVELVVDPTASAASFADRVGYVNFIEVRYDHLLIIYPRSAPKQVQTTRSSTNSKPKSATKNTSTVQRGTKAKRGRGGRTGNPRGKKPTAEELDADMADYFVGGSSGAATTAAVPLSTITGATNGDVGMDDDVLVSSS